MIGVKWFSLYFRTQQEVYQLALFNTILGSEMQVLSEKQ